MKKPILVIAILLAVNLSQAQWEPDVRLSDYPDISLQESSRSMDVSETGDTVHVVWFDFRDNFYYGEIYYKRSIDGGMTWGADTRLTNDDAGSHHPSIKVSGSVVHVTWCDSRDGDQEIYYKRSTDGGNSWGTDTRISYHPGNSWDPTIAISSEGLLLVWYEYNDPEMKIFYKRSTDGGLSWGPESQLTYSSTAYWPSICAAGPVVHVVWREKCDGNKEIYYKRSTDGGITWEADIRLTNDPANSQYPCISANDLVVHIVWKDDRYGNYAIFYKRSEDGGLSWGVDTWLTDSYGQVWGPSLAVSGSAVHIVWDDNPDGDFEIYYKRSENGGLSWGENTRLTNALGDSKYPYIAVSGPKVHVIWTDLRDGNDEIYYKRDPTGGFPVGTGNDLTDTSGQPVNIYPNPASTLLNIAFNSFRNENLALRIIDLSGRTIGTYNFNSSKGLNQYSIDLNDMGNGLYFIEITTGSVKYFRKLVISK